MAKTGFRTKSSQPFNRHCEPRQLRGVYTIPGVLCGVVSAASPWCPEWSPFRSSLETPVQREARDSYVQRPPLCPTASSLRHLQPTDSLRDRGASVKLGKQLLNAKEQALGVTGRQHQRMASIYNFLVKGSICEQSVPATQDQPHMLRMRRPTDHAIKNRCEKQWIEARITDSSMSVRL